MRLSESSAGDATFPVPWHLSTSSDPRPILLISSLAGGVVVSEAAVQDDIALKMVRPDMDHLPNYEISSPFSIRRYLPGDERAWQQIHIQADAYNTFPDSRFVEQFGTDEDRIRENQFYLCDTSGCPVGTATAWHRRMEGRARDDGLVHWVAIVPPHQGKRLSRPLLSAVCHRLRERGFERAHLDTSSARIAALALYLSFGFVPDIREPSHQAVWTRILERLGTPGQS